MKKIVNFIFFILVILQLQPLTALAQTDDDVALAEAYYKNNEFEKAVSLFDKLYAKKPDDPVIYTKYLTILKSLKQYDKAEKVIKKQIKTFDREPSFKFDLAQLYLLMGNEKKGSEQFESIIKAIRQPDDELIRKSAKLFTEYGMLDKALAVYLKGNKIMNDDSHYAYEIGGIYGKQGKTLDMFKLLIDVVEQQPNRMQETKNLLQPYLTNDNAMLDLQTILYKRIQKSPDDMLMPDLLIWSFLQRKDFESAMEQVKAIDKRLRQDGEMLMDVARSAVDEGFYDAAIDGYQYVVDKGASFNQYFAARNLLLKTRKLKITTTDNYTLNDLHLLKNDYLKTIGEFNEHYRKNEFIEANRDLAQLEALYFHQTDTAILILKDLIKNNTMDVQVLNKTKLDLGDYYLINGEEWESTLLYSQVDKALPGQPLGEMGKFKNAKWSYYFGDFEWAQAQMDVLKGSTSELMANDALDLAVFITENLGSGGDSIANLNGMKMFAHADLLQFQNKDNEALALYDSIKFYFKDNNLEDNIDFAKAEILIHQKKYADAIPLLDEIGVKWSDDILGDDALFTKADLFENKMGKQKEAMDLYSDLLVKFPGSTFAVEARKRFRKLRGDKTSE